MWHKVSFVANQYRLPEADLVDFALAHDAKYHIVVENGDAEVNTWNVDALIKDFRVMLAEDDLDEAEYLANNFAHVMPDVGCEFDPKLG